MFEQRRPDAMLTRRLIFLGFFIRHSAPRSVEYICHDDKRGLVTLLGSGQSPSRGECQLVAWPVTQYYAAAKTHGSRLIRTIVNRLSCTRMFLLMTRGAGNNTLDILSLCL